LDLNFEQFYREITDKLAEAANAFSGFDANSLTQKIEDLNEELNAISGSINNIDLANRVDSLTLQMQSISNSINSFSGQLQDNVQTIIMLFGIIAAGTVISTLALIIIIFRIRRKKA
jgi:predicted PurR-regulated permease PerM